MRNSPRFCALQWSKTDRAPFSKTQRKSPETQRFQGFSNGRGRRARTLGTRFWSGCRDSKNHPNPAPLRYLPPARIVFDAVLMLLSFHCEKVKICTRVNKEREKRFLYIGSYVRSGNNCFICLSKSSKQLPNTHFQIHSFFPMMNELHIHHRNQNVYLLYHFC